MATSQYNPKNPDAYNQVNLENPAPPPSNITPIAGGSILHSGDFSSPNYKPNTQGWRLSAEGDLEALNGVFKGTIVAADGVFSGSLSGATGTFSGNVTAGSIDIPNATTVNSFHVEPDGDTFWGATTLAAAPGKVEKSGKATFTDIVATGTINAQAGYLSTGVFINTSNVIVCESAGLNVGIAGHVRGGQTDFATGDGFFLGYSGDYKFSVGDDSNYLRWDGVYLKLKGSFDVGATGVINNSVYLVADLPIAPITVGFNSPSALG